MDQHAVRLLSFLPGGNLWNIPYTKDLFYQVSNCYLKIDISLNCNSLKDLKHDGLKGIEPISNLGFWIFGDIYVLHYVFNYFIFELSIVICYMGIECKSVDIVDAADHVRTYQQVITIIYALYRMRNLICFRLLIFSMFRMPSSSSKCIYFLKDCILARFCQSLIYRVHILIHKIQTLTF